MLLLSCDRMSDQSQALVVLTGSSSALFIVQSISVSSRISQLIHPLSFSAADSARRARAAAEPPS